MVSEPAPQGAGSPQWSGQFFVIPSRRGILRLDQPVAGSAGYSGDRGGLGPQHLPRRPTLLAPARHVACGRSLSGAWIRRTRRGYGTDGRIEGATAAIRAFPEQVPVRALRTRPIHKRPRSRVLRTSGVRSSTKFATRSREGHSDFVPCRHIPHLSHSARRAPEGRKPRTSQPIFRGRQEVSERSLCNRRPR